MRKKENTAKEKTWFDAISDNHIRVVKEMVKANPDLLLSYNYSSFGATPLNLVASSDRREMADLLIELGADPNRKSDWSMGPWNPTQLALNHGDEEMAKHLIARGASVGVHEAAGLDMAEALVQMLQVKPELVHERGGDGCTALHFAGSKQVVDILLAHGADLNARDDDHFSTPAQYLAKARPTIAQYLFDRGADADIFSVVLIGDEDRFDGMIKSNPALLHLKINQQTFPPGPNPEVQNILTFIVGLNANLVHAAATGGQLKMIEKLINLGVDINAAGGYDDATALHVAAWCNDLPVAKKLVTLGAQIDKRSGKIHNNTPAGWAIVGGSADVFCYLIDQGAKIQAYFAPDIEAGLNGEFQKYQYVPLHNFERMKEKIDQKG